MTTSKLITLAATLVLLSCAPVPRGQSVVSQLGNAPTVSGGTFSSGGGITVAADLRERGGNTLVCGVWAESNKQSILTKNSANRVVSKGVIFLNGERLVQNFLFMNKVDPAPSYAGRDAGCRLLDRPWQASDANADLLIRIPRQIITCEGEGLRRFCVTFDDRGRPGAGTS